MDHLQRDSEAVPGRIRRDQEQRTADRHAKALLGH